MLEDSKRSAFGDTQNMRLQNRNHFGIMNVQVENLPALLRTGFLFNYSFSIVVINTVFNAAFSLVAVSLGFKITGILS